MNVFLAEFIGTSILIFIGCGVLAGDSLNKSGTFRVGKVGINMAWGFGVTMAVYTVGDISGAHLNPAFTIAKALNESIKWSLVPGYILSQILGAMFGSLLVYLQFLPHWEKTKEPEIKLNVFVTAPAIKNGFTNFISEYLITCILIFALLVLDRNSFVDGLKPIVVGGLIFTLGVSFGGVTGAALNPARDLGPRLAHYLLPIPGKRGSNFKYGWIPVVAPILGGATGAMVNLALYDGIVDFRILLVVSISAIILFTLKMKDKNTLDELKESISDTSNFNIIEYSNRIKK